MNRDWTRRIVFALTAALTGWSAASAAGVRPDNPRLAQNYGGGDLICNEIRQRFIVHRAASNPRAVNFLLFEAAAQGCLDLAQQALDLGAAVKARDRFGNTGLLIAARAGQREVVEFLLANGADVDHRNLAGSTALLRAATMSRRRTVKILLHAGADPNAGNKKGVSPLAAAAFGGDRRLVKLLVERGAATDESGADRKGAIIYAAGKGYRDIVAVLLDAGVDVNARYENGLTALMWAAGYSNDVPATEGLATVEFLHARGARHDLADDRGRTALMIAAERGHAEVVRFLLIAGADADARDKNGKAAIDLTTADPVRAALSSP